MTWPGLDLADAYAVQQDDLTRRPATAVARLAHTRAAFGRELNAGHIVLPGATNTAPFIGTGQKAAARFGALGSVSVSFV
ncbi:hypothetical protein [Streptomyces sp. AA1529]|uniref:hypothetical protein n=1 Tax=Streptomyces sp. AA1529 TaxID=1203257 RepID=UPI003D72B243